MKILIKSATIIDFQSPYNNKTKDILVDNGIIKTIANHIPSKKTYKEVERPHLHISQGWFDNSVCFGEPGFEERETLENGLKVGASSGFTHLVINPNTQPVIDTNVTVSFLKSKANHNAVNIYPIGALSIQSKGVELAELFDMKNAGAVAFGDYKQSIKDTNFLTIALQYCKAFDGLVLSFPLDESLAQGGSIHEGIMSARLGLKGIPEIAETTIIKRDLSVLEYTVSKLHIPTISTAKSVDLIREAKAKGLNVSCSVAIHNLMFTDNALHDFNSAFKVSPPLRSKTDRDALILGLKDGTIDMVTSDHNPLNIELKQKEFNYTSYGTIGLESAFGALQSLFTLKQTIRFLTQGKHRFGIKDTPIQVDKKANITFFNPDHTFIFSADHIHSKSKNSMFIGSKLKGKTYGVLANNNIFLKD